MEPWSTPDSGPIAPPFNNYQIDENCAIGFNPSFTGWPTNLQAGAYTTFQAPSNARMTIRNWQVRR